MKTNTIRVLLALASVALAFVALTSTHTFAGVQKSSGGNALSGTSWQLVKFQGPDERTFTPDDKSKYTIKFGSNGRVVARVDCNRANSTWKVTSSGELQFGVLVEDKREVWCWIASRPDRDGGCCGAKLRY